MLLDTDPITSQTATEQFDFLTLSEELPAEVSVSEVGAKERSTYCTDVKHETTDDN